MASEGCQCLIFTSVFTSVPLVHVGNRSFMCSSSSFTHRSHLIDHLPNMSFCSALSCPYRRPEVFQIIAYIISEHYVDTKLKDEKQRLVALLNIAFLG